MYTHNHQSNLHYLNIQVHNISTSYPRNLTKLPNSIFLNKLIHNGNAAIWKYYSSIRDWNIVNHKTVVVVILFLSIRTQFTRNMQINV